MGRHECSSGHRWKTRFQPSPRELFCKECGEGAVPALKAASNRRNALQAAEEPVVAEAHLRFTQLVTLRCPRCRETRRVRGGNQDRAPLGSEAAAQYGRRASEGRETADRLTQLLHDYKGGEGSDGQ